MNLIDFFGYAAATCTTCSFIPQIVKIMKTKSTKDMSLEMFVIFLMGVIFWLAYGIFIKSFPVIVANGILLIFNLVILGYKFKYR